MPMSEYVRNLRGKIGTTVLEVPTVSVLVFDDQDRVLLVRHVKGNDWTTPGGMIEPYETPADAAVREMWEETGLHVALTHILGVFGGVLCSGTYSNGDQVAWVSTAFAATPIRGALRPDGEETWRPEIFRARRNTEDAMQAACATDSFGRVLATADLVFSTRHMAAAECLITLSTGPADTRLRARPLPWRRAGSLVPLDLAQEPENMATVRYLVKDVDAALPFYQALGFSVPATMEFTEFAEAGGLMAYGPSWADFSRRAGEYAGKILKGAKPADLPVEQPTNFEFVINLKTAKALGLTIPPSLLLGAKPIE